MDISSVKLCKNNQNTAKTDTVEIHKNKKNCNNNPTAQENRKT